MDVSVIIPAYNEADRIGSALPAVAGYFEGLGSETEIVVVDDGSTDGTPLRVAELAGEVAGDRPHISLRQISINHGGKGAAVRAGVKASLGARVLMSDADLSTPIEEWAKLARELDQGAMVAIGSRQAPGADIELAQPWARQRLGLAFGKLVRTLFPLGVIDSQCGFKAFEREAALEIFRRVRSAGYCFDVEVILIARHLGFEIAEVPVKWRNHPDSRVKVVSDWASVTRELADIRRRMDSGFEPVGDGRDR